MLQQNQPAKKHAAAVGTVTATTKRIDEEAPAYRSVMVGSSSTGPQGLLLSSTSSTGTAEKSSPLPASTRPFPPPPNSFAAMPPPPHHRLVRGTSNDAVSLSSAASVSTWGSGVSSSVVLPPPASSAPVSSRWTVPPTLTSVPASYTLVRTHVSLPLDDDPTTPQRVADTLCTTLKALSITTTTTFDDEYEHDATFEDAPAVTAAASSSSSEEEHVRLTLHPCVSSFDKTEQSNSNSNTFLSLSYLIFTMLHFFLLFNRTFCMRKHTTG